MEGLDTKSGILRIAAELFSEQGYYRISVREICEAAGVTKPVLYYYFKDKDDLLAQLIKECYLRFNKLMDLHIDNTSSFPEKLNGLLKVYIEYVDSYLYLIKLSAHAGMSPVPSKIKNLNKKKTDELMERIYLIFIQGKEEKFFKPGTDIKMLALSLFASWGVTIAQSVFGDNNQDLLKRNLKEYFKFWKSHFLVKDI